MCVNNDFIENQSNRIYEEISKSTLLKVARVEFQEGYCWEPQFEPIQFNKNNLITKIILKDDKNNSFTINPDEIGLKFAKGEISYKEYLRVQKVDDFKWIGFSILGVGIIISMMFTFYIYFS
ncbi:SH3 domain-containing protein [Ureibacillus acetophenoni]|uniref:Uncharacterized protein n=1 Tax=Ureibacillus acetophenoni TaxID=614649 RepID=A0A285UGD0_9BACL|nr:hypothetical protein [Ureibacillus acetophenoni]SOC40940.1 hypothetical protein SAMN05877842_10937 [Ureibacillus acetophenoni]